MSLGQARMGGVRVGGASESMRGNKRVHLALLEIVASLLSSSCCVDQSGTGRVGQGGLPQLSELFESAS